MEKQVENEKKKFVFYKEFTWQVIGGNIKQGKLWKYDCH